MYQQIRLDAGGSLRFDPPQQGRATSATFTLYEVNGSDEVAASASAENDPANTTLGAAAVAGADSMTLASSTGLVIGRRFLVTAAADNESEWVRVAAFTSAGVVTTAEPLLRDYAIGDAFVGNRITMPVSAAHADDLDEGYEARLLYTVGGVEHVTSIYYDVVRQPWPDVILRADEFAVYAGSLSARALERSSSDGLGFSDEIATATTLLREELLDRGVRPDLFRSFDGFRRSVALKVLSEWADEGVNIPSAYQHDPEAWSDKARGRYQRALGRAMNTVRTYDANQNAAVDDDEREVRRGSYLITR